MKWPKDGSFWRDPIALVWVATAVIGLGWTIVGAAMWLFG